MSPPDPPTHRTERRGFKFPLVPVANKVDRAAPDRFAYDAAVAIAGVLLALVVAGALALYVVTR